jgi:hypothetical protein
MVSLARLLSKPSKCFRPARTPLVRQTAAICGMFREPNDTITVGKLFRIVSLLLLDAATSF